MSDAYGTRWVLKKGMDTPPEKETIQSLQDGHIEDLKMGQGISGDMLKAPSKNAEVVERGMAGGLVERAHMDALLSTGYLIIYKQLEGLLERSIRGEVLTATETKQLEAYLKLVRTLGQEERDQRKADAFDKLPTDKLEELAGIRDPEDE